MAGSLCQCGIREQEQRDGEPDRGGRLHTVLPLCSVVLVSHLRIRFSSVYVPYAFRPFRSRDWIVAVSYR
jgi:hypothetical protein